MSQPIIIKPTLQSDGQTWVMASGILSAGATRVFYMRSYANYWLCSSASGGAGTKYRVAKPDELVNSVSGETVFGLAFTYVFSHNPGGSGYTGTTDPLYGIYRISTRTSDSYVEYQAVLPQPGCVANRCLMIVPDNSTGITIETQDVTDNGAGAGTAGVTSVTFRDLNIAGGAWTALGDQSYGH